MDREPAKADDQSDGEDGEINKSQEQGGEERYDETDDSDGEEEGDDE